VGQFSARATLTGSLGTAHVTVLGLMVQIVATRGDIQVNAIKPVLMASLFLCAGNAFAQSVDKEPVAVVELGELLAQMSKTADRASAPPSRLRLRR
jgi:hypothetical protein